MKKQLLLCIVVLSISVAQAQKLVLNTRDYLPLVVVVCKQQDEGMVSKSIQELPAAQQNRYHYLILFGDEQTRLEMGSYINELLDKDRNTYFDKQHMYLLYLRESEQPIMDNELFAERIAYNPLPYQTEFPLGTILSTFAQKYTWKIAIENIEARTRQEIFHSKRIKWGAVMGFNFQNTLNKDSAYVPPKIVKLGVMLGYDINARISLSARLMASFKIPNTDRLQSEMRKQMNPRAEGTQKISAEIKFHVLMQANLQANYFLNTTKQLRPYVGVGVTIASVQSARVKIEQTINMEDMASMMGSGGPGGGLGAGLGLDPTGDMPMFKKSFVEPFIAGGFHYRMIKNTDFVFNAEYGLKTGTYKEQNVTLKHSLTKLSFNMGLLFTFGKTKYFNHYFVDK
jgi:hypothetical protein